MSRMFTNQVIYEDEEDRFQKINGLLEKVFYHPKRNNASQFVASWIFFSLCGLILSIIVTSIIGVFVSIPSEVTTVKIETSILLMSFVFAMAYYTIRIDNYFYLKWIKPIANSFKKIFFREKKSKNIVDVLDYEDLLFFAAFTKQNIETTSPELFEAIVEEVQDIIKQKDLQDSNLNVKKALSEAARGHLEISKDVKKIMDFLSLNKFPKQLEGEDDK